MFNRRIAVFNVAFQNTGAGVRQVDPPALRGHIWAARKDVSDAEKAASGTVQATLAARFTVRSSAMTRAIKPKDRLTCDGKSFDIVGIKELGRRDFLEITAEARAD